MQFKTFAGALVLAITTAGFAASSIAAPVKEPAPAHKQVKAKTAKTAPVKQQQKKATAKKKQNAPKRMKHPAVN